MVTLITRYGNIYIILYDISICRLKQWSGEDEEEKGTSIFIANHNGISNANYVCSKCENCEQNSEKK